MGYMYDAIDETGTATIGRPELRPAKPTMTSKLAGQIAGLMSKAAMAHDAGDRQLEASYTAKADTLRKAGDPSAPLLTPDNGISVGQQLLDLAAAYAGQVTQAQTSNSSRSAALTATAAALTARATALAAGA